MTFTREWIQERGKALAAPFADGFQAGDIWPVIHEGMEIVEGFREASGEEKEAAVIELLTEVVKNTDTPWLPDSITDPLFIMLIKAIVPGAMRGMVKASKGLLGINKSSDEGQADEGQAKS